MASFGSCARVRFLSRMRNKKQNLGGSRARRWYAYLWHEWNVQSRRPIAPAFARPNPTDWSDKRITAAWLGHATVLINFFGIKILTDPVLFPRIGIRLPGLTLGPKRLTASRAAPSPQETNRHQDQSGQFNVRDINGYG